MRSTIQRQYTLVQGEFLNEKAVDEFVNQPEKGKQMLQEVLLGSYSVEVENAVSDIVDKCRDVQLLEKVPLL